MSSDLGNNPERDSRSDARKAEPTGTPRPEDIASSHASISEARIQHARGILKTEGFSAEQIDTIQERFFGNELRVYRPQFGERVSDVAKAMIELRDLSTVPVIARFGSVLLIAELDRLHGGRVAAHCGVRGASAESLKLHDLAVERFDERVV
jgi:hypothetical protein